MTLERLKHQLRWQPDLLLDTVEVAELLQYSQRTIRQWADKGLLQVIRTLGGHNRFRGADVLAIAEAQR